jgi:AcrR family transcriptional regulator
LIALLLAKPFEEITVQEVLDRARVSRSTFYAHYRDKHDLLVSDVDDFLAAMSTLLERRGDRSGRLAPVAELFEHVAQARELYAVMMGFDRVFDLRELGEGHLARGIATRLARAPWAAALPAETRGALAHGYAGSLFALLAWWVRQGMVPSAAEMDRFFHASIVGHAAEGRSPAAPRRPCTPRRVAAAGQTLGVRGSAVGGSGLHP